MFLILKDITAIPKDRHLLSHIGPIETVFKKRVFSIELPVPDFIMPTFKDLSRIHM